MDNEQDVLLLELEARKGVVFKSVHRDVVTKTVNVLTVK